MAVVVLVGCGGDEPAAETGSGPADEAASYRRFEVQSDGPHDGGVVETERHRFELVLGTRDLRVYGYTRGGDPLGLGGVQGSVRILRGDGWSDPQRLRFHPEDLAPHQEDPGPGYLQAHFDSPIFEARGDTAALRVRLTGVPGVDQPIAFETIVTSTHGSNSD